jgi:acetyl-CoA carboxylase carboxyl transferase subunit beta
MVIVPTDPDKTEPSQEGVSAPAPSEKRKKSIPAGLWVKCPKCQSIIFKKSLEENLSVCSKCSYHFTLGAHERIQSLVDEGTFTEFDPGLRSLDPLHFRAVKSYKEKISQDVKKTGLHEACIVGKAELLGHAVAIGVTDSRFIMGSMGSVVGEKIARLAEYAQEHHLPLIIISGSGGGARMYEGIFSLMQMAKTSAAIGRAQENGVLYISILTDPTMGGVMASFAALGDVILAEPSALIGFAGPRVIEQTIRQKLPKNFQTAEFLMDHGMVDLVVNRKDMKNTLGKLMNYLVN